MSKDRHQIFLVDARHCLLGNVVPLDKHLTAAKDPPAELQASLDQLIKEM